MASADPGALQAFLRASAAAGRTTLVVGPFTVHLHPHDPLRYLNYAIPAVGARPGQGDIAELRAAFRAHDRLPRLEWVEEAAPRMAAALRAAGMEEELRTPLMACLAGALADVRADVDELVVSAVGADDVRAAANLQRMAFGRPPLPADVPASDPRQGGGAVLARAGGRPAAAATWTAVIDGCSEVAGVATAEPWRRRGLAGVVTAAAARAAFAAGAERCVLSPGDETAQRVYERAGFRRAATMLHWSDPA